MGLKSWITDKATGKSVEVDDAGGTEKKSLVVATRDLKAYINTILPFLNSTYGADMNQNCAYGGVPEKVHDGIDSVLWTGSSITGVKFTFNSGDQNHTPAGAKSVKTDNAAVNDVMQFAKGANLTVSDYVALTMWIYIDKDWKAGDSIKVYGYDVGVGQVGNSINLENYFNWSDYGTWHEIAIPLTDMALASGTIDAIRIEIVAKEGKSPKFYLDDIQFEQTGTPAEFCIKPSKGTWLHVYGLTIVMADETPSILADGTMPYLAYNKLLGEMALPIGILFQRLYGERRVRWSVLFKQLIDFLAVPNETNLIHGSDGTNTWISLYQIFTSPVILKDEDLDKMCFKISDNLSGLLLFKINAACRIEERE